MTYTIKIEDIPEEIVPSGVVLPEGFVFGATNCRIRGETYSKADTAIFASVQDSARAIFLTRNAVKAAPVLLCKELLAGQKSVRALIANSGNANACTGDHGMRTAQYMQQKTAELCGCETDQIVPMSTGVIGRYLEPELFDDVDGIELSSTEEAFRLAAGAICTTDRYPKIWSTTIVAGNESVALTIAAKGAGMIDPSLATMLVWIGTDAKLSNEQCEHSLQHALAQSLNRISVDNDMSTNDTVLMMANGAKDVDYASIQEDFDAALIEGLQTIAKMIVRDGEGSNHSVEIRIKGAPSDAKANAIARHLARSQLIKTAIFGADPNWGRIAASVGAAETNLDPDALHIWIGGESVFAEGTPANTAVLNKIARYLSDSDEVIIEADLRMGDGAATFWTSDLGYEYVRINAEYTT